MVYNFISAFCNFWTFHIEFVNCKQIVAPGMSGFWIWTLSNFPLSCMCARSPALRYTRARAVTVGLAGAQIEKLAGSQLFLDLAVEVFLTL